MKQLIYNGTVVTYDENNPFIVNGSVLFEDGIIKEVNAAGNINEKHTDAVRIDARGGIILPGFINIGGSCTDAFHRCVMRQSLTTDGEYLKYKQHRYKTERALKLEHCMAGAYIYAYECISKGITASIIKHASPMCASGSLACISTIMREAGLRSCIGYEVNDKHGERWTDAEIIENSEFFDYCELLKSESVASVFGLASSMMLSDATIEKCIEINQDRMRFMLDLGESPDDLYASIREYGQRPVERLIARGIIKPGSIVKCGAYMDFRDIELLRQESVMAYIDPIYDLTISGKPACEALYETLPVLGAGSASLQSGMIDTLKFAGISLRLADRVGKTDIKDMFDKLMNGNSTIASKLFGAKTGKLISGYAADIIIIDKPIFIDINEDNYKSILMGQMGSIVCNTTIVNGKTLMRDGAVLTLETKNYSNGAVALLDEIRRKVNGK